MTPSRSSVRPLSRYAPREPLLLRCRVWRERDRLIVSQMAFDLSAGGMQVLTSERVLTGEPVRAQFQAPKSGQWVELGAHVARVIHGRRPGEWGRRLGLCFDAPSREDLARLVG
jgi:hypothetical protein